MSVCEQSHYEIDPDIYYVALHNTAAFQLEQLNKHKLITSTTTTTTTSTSEPSLNAPSTPVQQQRNIFFKPQHRIPSAVQAMFTASPSRIDHLINILKQNDHLVQTISTLLLSSQSPLSQPLLEPLPLPQTNGFTTFSHSTSDNGAQSNTSNNNVVIDPINFNYPGLINGFNHNQHHKSTYITILTTIMDLFNTAHQSACSVLIAPYLRTIYRIISTTKQPTFFKPILLFPPFVSNFLFKVFKVDFSCRIYQSIRSSPTHHHLNNASNGTTGTLATTNMNNNHNNDNSNPATLRLPAYSTYDVSPLPIWLLSSILIDCKIQPYEIYSVIKNIVTSPHKDNSQTKSIADITDNTNTGDINMDTIKYHLHHSQNPTSPHFNHNFLLDFLLYPHLTIMLTQSSLSDHCNTTPPRYHRDPVFTRDNSNNNVSDKSAHLTNDSVNTKNTTAINKYNNNNLFSKFTPITPNNTAAHGLSPLFIQTSNETTTTTTTTRTPTTTTPRNAAKSSKPTVYNESIVTTTTPIYTQASSVPLILNDIIQLSNLINPSLSLHQVTMIIDHLYQFFSVEPVLTLIQSSPHYAQKPQSIITQQHCDLPETILELDKNQDLNKSSVNNKKSNLDHSNKIMDMQAAIPTAAPPPSVKLNTSASSESTSQAQLPTYSTSPFAFTTTTSNHVNQPYYNNQNQFDMTLLFTHFTYPLPHQIIDIILNHPIFEQIITIIDAYYYQFLQTSSLSSSSNVEPQTRHNRPTQSTSLSPSTDLVHSLLSHIPVHLIQLIMFYASDQQLEHILLRTNLISPALLSLAPALFVSLFDHRENPSLTRLTSRKYSQHIDHLFDNIDKDAPNNYHHSEKCDTTHCKNSNFNANDHITDNFGLENDISMDEFQIVTNNEGIIESSNPAFLNRITDNSPLSSSKYSNMTNITSSDNYSTETSIPILDNLSLTQNKSSQTQSIEQPNYDTHSNYPYNHHINNITMHIPSNNGSSVFTEKLHTNMNNSDGNNNDNNINPAQDSQVSCCCINPRHQVGLLPINHPLFQRWLLHIIELECQNSTTDHTQGSILNGNDLNDTNPSSSLQQSLPHLSQFLPKPSFYQVLLSDVLFRPHYSLVHDPRLLFVTNIFDATRLTRQVVCKKHCTINLFRQNIEQIPNIHPNIEFQHINSNNIVNNDQMMFESTPTLSIFNKIVNIFFFQPLLHSISSSFTRLSTNHPFNNPSNLIKFTQVLNVHSFFNTGTMITLLKQYHHSAYEQAQQTKPYLLYFVYFYLHSLIDNNKVYQLDDNAENTLNENALTESSIKCFDLIATENCGTRIVEFYFPPLLANQEIITKSTQSERDLRFGLLSSLVALSDESTIPVFSTTSFPFLLTTLPTFTHNFITTTINDIFIHSHNNYYHYNSYYNQDVLTARHIDHKIYSPKLPLIASKPFIPTLISSQTAWNPTQTYMLPDITQREVLTHPLTVIKQLHELLLSILNQLSRWYHSYNMLTTVPNQPNQIRQQQFNNIDNNGLNNIHNFGQNNHQNNNVRVGIVGFGRLHDDNIIFEPPNGGLSRENHDTNNNDTGGLDDAQSNLIDSSEHVLQDLFELELIEELVVVLFIDKAIDTILTEGARNKTKEQ